MPCLWFISISNIGCGLFEPSRSEKIMACDWPVMGIEGTMLNVIFNTFLSFSLENSVTPLRFRILTRTGTPFDDFSLDIFFLKIYCIEIAARIEWWVLIFDKYKKDSWGEFQNGCVDDDNTCIEVEWKLDTWKILLHFSNFFGNLYDISYILILFFGSFSIKSWFLIVNKFLEIE